MSYSQMAMLLLEIVMKKAQIPGVSIAYLKEGSISTKAIGLTDGCGLCTMSKDPTQCPFKELEVGSKNSVILFNEELFYVDQQKKQVQKIERTDNNKTAFATLKARCTDTYKLASRADHQLIQSLTGHAAPTEMQPETIVKAASLSKPVFGYLVQKLIKANADNSAEPGTGKFILPEGKSFNLDTPLSDILPLEELKIDNMAHFDLKSSMYSADKLTARMVLAHATGLAHDEINFQFKPEEEKYSHGYSNVAIYYLQKVIEKLTEPKFELALLSDHPILEKNKVYVAIQPPNLNYKVLNAAGTEVSGVIALEALACKPEDLTDGNELSKFLPQILEETAKLGHTPVVNLEVLAKKHLFDPLHMNDSSFITDKNKPREAHAANSLSTTASDYAKFVKELINDNTVENPFVPHVFMTEDKGKAGVNGKVEDADLTHVAWGLGWGLQTGEKGDVTTAYHSGDMDDYRAWVAINLKDKSAVVFFANSHNGHILADQIIPSSINVKHAGNYFFPKWGFARNLGELGGKTNNSGIKPALYPKPNVNPEPSTSPPLQQSSQSGEEEKTPASEEIDELDSNKGSTTPF